MSWDSVLLTVLAAFGCVTLLLTQMDDVLTRLPRIIRAWRNVREELRGGGDGQREGLRDGNHRDDGDADT
ncbi:hypothetical protein [Streptomyces venezuelae]|uniref:hypothetical protein n=1 Tax=Streptomyces venezuelae TaxID=54571 RepID=UPI0036382387